MRSFIEKYKNALRMKLAIFCASLFVCLALLEGGLRVTGFALESARQREFIPPFDEKVYHVDETFERYLPERTRDRLVLAFGDSLTNGGNVKSYNSYPYYLYKNFSDSSDRTAVYNMGYCEDSTFGVSLKLKNYLKTHSAEQIPDAVVILVGAADLFNIPLINERKLKDDTFWHDVLPRGFYNLRLYKVYRHIRLNLSMRRVIRPESDASATAEKYAILSGVYKKYKEASGGEEGAELPSELATIVEENFPEDIRQADLDVEIPGDFADLLTDYAGRVYTTQHRYDDFFTLLLDVAETFPRDFWNDYFNSPNYHFIQTYQVQSKYTAEDVLARLKPGERKHPDLRHNEYYRHFQRILRDREEMDRYVDQKRMETWDEIVRLSREKNVQVVLQNYPVAYKGANKIIEQVAKKYGLPLIDNQTYFEELIAREGREKYLEDDDHLKPVGNQLLARRIYDVLKSLPRR